MIVLARAFRNPSAVIIANAGFQSLIRFASNVVLAHLLMPTAFAMTSITMLIITGIQMISDVGIAIMTLRQGHMSKVEQARMWTMQLTRGMALSLILVLIAKPVAMLYQTPELAYVLIMLSIVPTVQGAQSLFPILALAQQNLMPTFWVDVVGRALGTALSILIAIFYPTVWALAIGILGQVLFSTLIGHWLSKQGWPKFDFDLSYIRSHWQFSKWIQLGSTMTFAASQIDKALFPLLYGIARFGVYGIGANFALIPAQITQRWSSSIFYPLMVNNIRGGIEARQRLEHIRTTMLCYSSVIVVSMIFISSPFFYILYKPTYHEAARFAMMLAAASYFEVAESSLRHYPLVDKTARYEFVAVIVQLGAFISMVTAIWLSGADAELYALSFTAAQAVSFAFMLSVCVRGRYVRAKVDVTLMVLVGSAISLAYAFPTSPDTTFSAILAGGAIGCAACGLLLLVFYKRGLPSLPRTLATDITLQATLDESHAVT